MKEFFKKYPKWVWFTGLALYAFEGFLYFISQYLIKWLGTINYAFETKLKIDEAIPLIPGFIYIYTIVSYSFWIIFPVIIAIKVKKEDFLNIAIATLIALVIGFLIFVFIPTVQYRVSDGIIASAEGEGFTRWLLRTIYKSDGYEVAHNMAPSYHCLISLMCYLGIHKEKNVSIWYKVFAFIITVSIILSTLFTRQHYIIDVISAILLGLISYSIVYIFNIGKKIIEKSNN